MAAHSTQAEQYQSVVQQLISACEAYSFSIKPVVTHQAVAERGSLDTAIYALLAATTLTCWGCAPNAVLPPKGEEAGVAPNAGCDCPKPAANRRGAEHSRLQGALLKKQSLKS
jgi:hypothetical protein